MPALSQFYNQSFEWYLNPSPGRYGPCQPARNAVYQRQTARFGGPLTLRHVPQTSAVLNRANVKAREAADRARYLRMMKALGNERKAA